MFKIELVIDGEVTYFENEVIKRELVELVDAIYGTYNEIEYRLSLCFPIKKLDSAFKTYSEANDRVWHLYDDLGWLFFDTEKPYPLMIKDGHYFLYRIVEVKD